MPVRDLQAYYQTILNNRIKEYNDAVKKYYEELANIQLEKVNTPTFFDYLGAVYNIGSQGLKGYKNAWANFGSFGVNVITGFFNDLYETGKASFEGDFDEAGRDFIRSITNPVLMFAEALVGGATGLGASVSELIGAAPLLLGLENTGWQNFFGKGADFLLDSGNALNVLTNATRAYIEGEEKAFTALNDLFGRKDYNTTLSSTPSAESQRDRNKQVIEEEYLDTPIFGTNDRSLPQIPGATPQVRAFTYGDFLRSNAKVTLGITEVTDSWFDAIINGFGLFDTTERVEEAFGGAPVYETLKGVADSVGAIFAMRTVGKMAAQSGLSPAQVSGASQAFFFGNIAGQSVNEALENGSDIQDALSYGLAIAASETAIENLMGIKFGAINQSVAQSGWSFIKNGLEEGIEEVIAEFVRPGYEQILTGERTEIDPKETVSDSFTAFLSGFAASSFVGLGQAIVLNNTVENRNKKLLDKFDKYVERYGQQVALEKMRLEIANFVKYINGKNVKGQVYNQQGATYIETLNQRQKDNIVNNSIIKFVVEKQQDGTYKINEEALNKLTYESFKNKDAQGQVIKNEDYAINDSVFGVDITQGNVYNVKKVENLNAQERIFYEASQKYNVPIAIFEGTEAKKLTFGEYGENGVFYVNSKNITEGNVARLVLEVSKHEPIHALKVQSPELYEQLRQSVSNLVTIEYDKETKRPTVIFANEEIKQQLPELESAIESSFADYVLEYGSYEKAVKLMDEEIVAYFVEQTISDGALVKVIGKKDKKLLDRISDFFGIQGNVETNLNYTSVKQINRYIKDYANTWRSAMEVYQRQQRSLVAFVAKVFQDEARASLFFSQAAINQYGAKELLDALKNTYDKETNTIQINGARIFVDSIRNPNFTFDEVRPKKTRTLTDDELSVLFEYNIKESGEYYVQLRRYETFIDSGIDYLPRRSKEFLEAKERLNLIEKLMDQYREDKVITPSPDEMYILAEAWYSGKVAKETQQRKQEEDKKRNPVISIYNTSITRFVNAFKESTAFEFKNRNQTYGAAVYQQEFETKEEAEDTLTVIELLIENVTTKKGKNLLRGKYEVDYKYDSKTKVATFLVTPTREYVQEQVDAKVRKYEMAYAETVKPTDVGGTNSNGYPLSQQQAEYFKNSVVRDEKNQLMPLYHGSLNTDITRFSVEYYGTKTGVPDKYIFFTNDFQTADKFSREYEQQSLLTQRQTGKKGKVYTVYLDIQNPLDLRNLNEEQIKFIARAAVKNRGEEYNSVLKQVRKFAKNKNFFDHGMLKMLFTAFDVLNEGYDGLIAEMYPNSGILEYGVFFAEQIKAIENLTPEETDDIYDDIRPKKSKTRPLTQEEKDKILEVFPDDKFIDTFFEVSPNGNYVAKESLVRSSTVNRNYATLKQKDAQGNEVTNIYKSNEYAVSVDLGYDYAIDLTDSQYKDIEIVRLETILNNPQTAAIYHIFKNLGIRFIGYDTKTEKAKLSRYLGFSINRNQNDAVFINFRYFASDPGSMYETIFHELTHEIFKTNRQALIELARLYRNVFFLRKAGTSDYIYSPDFKAFDTYFTERNGTTFFKYLRSSYPDTKSFLRKSQDLYDLFDAIIEGRIDINNDSLEAVSAINEILAQFTGYIIASDTLINELFQVEEFEKLRLFNFYEQIINNGSKSKRTLAMLGQVGSAFNNAYIEHQKIMQERFPAQTIKFTTKEANEFIKTFTDGKYTTKAKLIKAYQEELRSGKKGDATFVFNSIISLASKFARTVQGSVKSMENVKQYFQQQLDAIQMLIDNPEDATYISDKKMSKAFSKLERTLNAIGKKIFQLIEQNNNGQQVVNPFDDAQNLNDFFDLFNDFIDQYSAVDPQILDIFDLTESSIIENLGQQIQQQFLSFVISTERYAAIANKDQSVVGQRLNDTLQFLQGFKNLIDALQPIKNLKNKDYSLLMDITKLQADIFDLETNRLYLILKNATQRTFNAINSGNQAKSTMNADLIDAFDSIKKLLDEIKSPVMSMTSLKGVVLKTIKELDRIITSSDRILEIYASYDERTGQIDRQQTVDDLRIKFLFDLYGIYGAIFNEQNALYDQDLGNFADANNQTVESLGYTKNYYHFGKAFSKLFLALQTEYLSVFGEIPYKKLVEQESKIVIEMQEENPQGIKQLKKLKEGKIYSPIEMRLPQHIMQSYADIFSRSGSSLFQKFFDLYVDMTMRRSSIISTYEKQNKEFLKTHKDIQKFEYEKIKVPVGLTYGLPENDLNKIVNKVKDRRQERKDKLKSNNEQIKDIKKSVQESLKRLAVLSELRRKVRKTSDEYSDYTEEINKIKKEIKRARIVQKALQNENDTIKNTTISFQEELQAEFVVYAEDNNLEVPEMTRGELIKLYMDIKREYEMHNQTNSTNPYEARIKPTEHYDVGGSFQIFDSVYASEKGYEKAKARASETSYVIVKSREEMIEILEDFMKDDANYSILINEAKRVNQQNYDYINEIYRAKFRTSLPKEEFYSPFRTNNSDWIRNFELRRKNKTNISPADGFTLETTLGARTPLVIQNVSSVMSGTTTAAANYSYERLITDFQSLIVSKVDKTTTYGDLLGKIDGSSFLLFFERTFTDVLGYGLERLSAAERAISEVQNLTIASTMALSFSVYFKQFISISKISFGTRLNPIEIMFNILKHGVPFVKTELRQWLLENNSNMYQRSEYGGVANIAQTTTADTFTTFRRNVRKYSSNVKEFFGRFNNHADSTVLVAAFATLVRKVGKQNPNLTREQVLEKANDIFTRQTLLYDVANTDTAFRTRFSTGKNFGQRYVSKYMSENMIHYSNFFQAIANWRAGIGGFGEILSAFLQFFISSVLSALIGTSFARLNNQVNDDELFVEFAVNELLLQNLIGAIPYANLIMSPFQFADGSLERVYDVQLPLVSDGVRFVENSARLFDTIQKVANGEVAQSKIYRDLLRLVEGTANFTGIPIPNIRKALGYILKLETEWFGGDSYYAFEEFWYSKTSAQQFGSAVAAKDEDKMNNYIGRTLENVSVKQEIIDVLMENDDASLSLRFNLDTFKAKDPVSGEMVTYKIPEKTREKYKILTQKALSFLIKTSKYKKLSAKEKLEAIQRVFNYYYNFMKNEILVEEYKSLPAKVKLEIKYDNMRKKKMLDFKEVINNALRKYDL